MKVLEYLQQKYKGDSPTVLTNAEAKIFGIPIPLQKGWLAQYGGTEISSPMADALKAEAISRYQRGRRFSQQALDAIGVSALEYAAIPIKQRTEKQIRRAAKKAAQAAERMKPLARPAAEVDPMARDFLSSYEWRAVRMQALRKYGARCQCCGASPETGAVMNVDHIKPRKIFPELALDVNNLQVLCHECNHGKGNWDMTDWRKTARI